MSDTTNEVVASEGVTIPSSPADRKRLKDMIVECTHCLQRIEDQKEAMKDIVETIQNEFTIPKKMGNKLARTMFKRNYDSLQQENEDFENLYELVVEGAKAQANLDSATE